MLSNRRQQIYLLRPLEVGPVDIVHAQCLLAAAERDWATIVRVIAEKAGYDPEEFAQYPLLLDDWAPNDSNNAEEILLSVYPLKGYPLSWSNISGFAARWAIHTGSLLGRTVISAGYNVYLPDLIRK